MIDNQEDYLFAIRAVGSMQAAVGDSGKKKRKRTKGKKEQQRAVNPMNEEEASSLGICTA